jgi:hypothetical protein
MDTLLVVAIVVAGLAILVQAGVLVAMYLTSRRIAGRVERLIHESQHLVAPMETVTQNLKSMSADFADLGKVARHQVVQVDSMMTETREALARITTDIRTQVGAGIDRIEATVMGPVHEWAAIAAGVTKGIKVLFGGRVHRHAETREDTAA